MVFWSHHPRARAVVGVAVGAIVGGGIAGGIAYAVAPDAGGVIHACYSKLGGGLRVINSGHCNALETALDWNQTGPVGPTGAPGPAGRDGTNGADGKDGRDGTDGAPGPKGDAGGLTDSYGQSGSSPVNLGSDRVAIATKAVPAGNYVVVVSGEALASFDVPLALVTCVITGPDGGVLAQRWIGLSGDDGSSISAVSLLTQANLPAGGTLSFVCQSSRNAGTSVSGSLIALQVGALH